MTTLGQRLSDKVLRRMVKEVSEDKENETLEFNEYLTMLGLQNVERIEFDSLLEALRVFDKDEDDHLSITELKKVLTTMGQRMKERDFDEMIKAASMNENGLINLQDFCSFLVHGKKKKSP